MQGKRSEDEIARELLEVSRQNGSEDDVTIIVVQITFDLS
jgi:serine phosphatase RsbU (regulator of sigma subunit)